MINRVFAAWYTSLHLCGLSTSVFRQHYVFGFFFFLLLLLLFVVKCHAYSRLKIAKRFKALSNTGRPMKGHTPTFTLCACATGVKVHCV